MHVKNMHTHKNVLIMMQTIYIHINWELKR